MLEFDETNNFRDLGEDRLRIAGATGYEIVRSGEVAFLRTLSSLRQDGGNPLVSRHKADLGVLFTWLQRVDEKSDFGPLKTILREHIFRTYPVNKGQSVLGVPCPDNPANVLTQASHELGIPKQRVDRMIVAAGFAERKDGKLYLRPERRLSVDTIKALALEADRYICPAEALELLGVRADAFPRFLDEGLIRKIENPAHQLRIFDKNEIQALLDDIHAKTRRTQAAAQRLSPLYNCGAGQSAAVKSILDRRLKKAVWKGKAEGLRSVLIDLDELHTALDGNEGAFIFQSKAAQSIGTNQPGIRTLIRLGYLMAPKTCQPLPRHTKVEVCRASLDHFLEKHETLARLSRRSGIHQAGVFQALRLAGVEPLPRLKGVVCTYLKSDLLDRRNELAEHGILLGNTETENQGILP